MTTLPGMYDEFARQLGFPEYFGKNAQALLDSIVDTIELAGEENALLIIKNSDLLLACEKEDLKECILDTLQAAADDLGMKVSEGGPWDRDAIHLDVFLS